MLHLLLFRAIKKSDVRDVMFHLTVTVSEAKHGGAFRFMENDHPLHCLHSDTHRYVVSLNFVVIE